MFQIEGIAGDSASASDVSVGAAVGVVGLEGHHNRVECGVELGNCLPYGTLERQNSLEEAQSKYYGGTVGITVGKDRPKGSTAWALAAVEAVTVAF